MDPLGFVRARRPTSIRGLMTGETTANTTANADKLDLGVQLPPGSILGQPLVRHACIRILVVPVGPISVSTFGNYFSSLCRFTKLSLQLVTPYPGSGDSDAVPWRSWQEGSLRFKFVVQGSAGEDQAQSLGELGWHTLQPHRRISAVIGICDWPKVKDIDAALKEFNAIVAEYPEGTLSRWCAFNVPDPQSMDQDALAKLLSCGMEIFDAEKRYEDGSSSFDLRMEMILCNLSTTLLERYDKIVSEGRALCAQIEDRSKPLPQISSEAPQTDSFLSMIMHGATYPGDEAIAQRISDQKTRTRMAGRLKAWIAGFALLAASPQDALELYNAAIRNCTMALDVPWQAVALEGSASALYLARLYPNEDPRFLSDVAEALRQAATFYAKQVDFWPLEADVSLKLAAYSPTDSVRVLAALSSKSAMHLHAAQAKCIGKHGGALNSSNAENALSDEEKELRKASVLFRDICIQSAMLFEHRGFSRKSSFMLQQAASHEYNWTDGLVLFQLAGERLGILPRFSIGNNESDVLRGIDVSDQKSKNFRKDRSAWRELKQVMLQTLVDAAQNAGHGQLAIDYTLQLLQLLQENSETNQDELSEVILSCVGSGGFTYLHRPCPFPIIDAMTLIDAPPPLELHKRSRKHGSSSASPVSLFYSPFAAQDGKPKLDKTWAQNEIFSVMVTLSNPMSFPVRVDSISLDIDPGVNVECHRASLRLRPRERGHRVSLSARPLAEGNYIIRGCNVSAMGLKSHHPIAEPFNVLIVPAMPCLSFEHLTHRQSVALKGTTELYEGELFPIECEMHGTSGVNITDIELTGAVSFEAPNAEIYRQNLVPPEYNSSSRSSLLQVFAIEGNDDGDSNSEYSSASSVTDYLITSSSKIESQRSKVQRVILGLDDTNSKLQQALQTLGGELSVPQRFQLMLQARRGCKNAALQMTYSAADLDFERRYNMSFDLHVQACMHVIYVNILQDPVRANDSSAFLVLLDVKNDSSQSFELRAVPAQEDSMRWTKQKGADPAQVKAEPFSVHRLALRVQKQSDHPVGDVLAWVDNTVRVEWIMSEDTSRKGRVSFASASLAPAAGDRLNSGLLALSLDLQKGTSEISVSVHNRSDSETLRDLSISVFVRPGPVTEKLLWDGALSILIQELPPHGERSFTVTYSLLMEGEAVSESERANDALELVLLTAEAGPSQRVWSTSASFSLSDLLN